MLTKTDARTLDMATLTHLRRSVVKVVREGMTQTAAATTFGVSLHAVNKWMALDKVGGLRTSFWSAAGVVPGVDALPRHKRRGSGSRSSTTCRTSSSWASICGRALPSRI